MVEGHRAQGVWLTMFNKWNHAKKGKRIPGTRRDCNGSSGAG